MTFKAARKGVWWPDPDHHLPDRLVYVTALLADKAGPCPSRLPVRSPDDAGPCCAVTDSNHLSAIMRELALSVGLKPLSG